MQESALRTKYKIRGCNKTTSEQGGEGQAKHLAAKRQRTTLPSLFPAGMSCLPCPAQE